MREGRQKGSTMCKSVGSNEGNERNQAGKAAEEFDRK